MGAIGVMREGHLHAALRSLYVEAGDRVEAEVDGYLVDVLRADRGLAGGRDGLIIEVQTGSFAKVARKMRDLVSRHRVRLVYPVARDRWIVKLPREPEAAARGVALLAEGQRRGGGADDGRRAAARRKSPKHPGVAEVFRELVSFPDLIGHERFELDVALVEEEVVWRYEGVGRWRRRGWAAIERRLVALQEVVELRGGRDYAALMGTGLGAEFVTADLAVTMGCDRALAQKAAYCLRQSGLIERVGSRGNAAVYALAARAV